MHGSLAWFGACAAIAIVVAIIARQRGWGMALPVMVAGAVVAAIPAGPDAPRNPEVILILILAPLVFGEALGSSYLDLRRVQRPVLALAVGLVLTTTVVVGLVVQSIAALPLAVALALGAILAPTDAVAVSTVARKAGLPHRLVAMLEGESLVNDGTGLTLLRVATVAAVAGSVSLLGISATFLLAVIGGIGVGVLGGWILIWIANHSRDAVAANGLVLVAPFGLYLVAENIDGSGILAVVVSALMLAHSQTSAVEHAGRLQSATVWRQLTFVLQAFAFFIVGMEAFDTVRRLESPDARLVVVLIAVVTVVLIVTRMVFVGLMMLFERHPGSGFRDAVIAGWAGARGPVSGLAAFTLPLVVASGEALPGRDIVLATTFGVIVVTLLLSLTVAPLARLLKVRADDESERLAQVDGALAHAALRRLDSIVEDASFAGQPLSDEVIEALHTILDERISRHRAPIAEDATTTPGVRREVERQMVMAEQEELLRIRDDEGLPDAIVRPLQQALDRRLLSL